MEHSGKEKANHWTTRFQASSPQERKIQGLAVFGDKRNIHLAAHCRKPASGMKLEAGVRLVEWSWLRL